MNNYNIPTNELAKEKIKQFLNDSKIRLWLEPYSSSDGSKKFVPNELIKDFSKKLELSESAVEQIIEELRVHSFAKFAANNTFNSRGLITVNFKFASASKNESNMPVDVIKNSTEIDPDSLGSDLKNDIASECGMPSRKLKLICSGKIIDEQATLRQQNLKNMSDVLVLCLTKEEEENLEKSENEMKISRAKKAANLVAGGQYLNLEVVNQSGASMELPEEEQRALTVAMMLHEKGRAALKRKEYSISLLYFIEADNEFLKCNSSVLEYVDNYALLCLDVVWCYFCLQQPSALLDAEKRLSMCEEKLNRTYGPNMEKVKIVRGGASKEEALMVRLHLMKGVLYFYKGLTYKSSAMFDKVENDLKALRVNEEDMTSVMQMGFSETEARLALRFCRGNVSRAIDHIMNLREEHKKTVETEKEKKKAKKLQKKLGKTANGNWIDSSLYIQLASMGFNKGASLEALRAHNNDMLLAIGFLQENRDLVLPDPEKEISFEEQTEEALANTMATFGMDPEIVKSLWRQNPTTLDQAVSSLLDMMGNTSEEIKELIVTNVEKSLPSKSNSAPKSTSSSGGSREENAEELNLVNEEILPDLNDEDDDYLDLTLDEEYTILLEFKARLASVSLTI